MSEYSDYSDEVYFDSILNEVYWYDKVVSMHNGSRTFMIKNKKVYIRANDKYREKINKERSENKKSIYLEFPAKELMIKTHEK